MGMNSKFRKTFGYFAIKENDKIPKKDQTFVSLGHMM